MEPAIERRPLRTRETPFARALSRRLAAAGVRPDQISAAGLAAGLLAGAAFASTPHAGPLVRAAWLAGAALVQLRLLANMLDGMVAIESGQRSRVGELWNEVPDRITDAATLAGLGYAAGSCPAAGWLAACLALFVAYVRAAGKAAGAGQQFIGPFAKPQRMFLVTVMALACAAFPAADWKIPAWTLGLLAAGCAATAARRLARIAAELRALERRGTGG